MSKDSDEDPVTFEPIYFIDPLECDGCKKKFCHAIRRGDSDERFCMNCFSHRYGTEEAMKILKKMDQVSSQLWEIPYDKLSEELKSLLTYIVKPEDKQE